jgi:RNA polymerase sigma-70 factor (ECF subfamily)
MKNILYEYSDIRLPKEVQLRRIRKVIDNELTASQRDVLLGIYFEQKTQTQIAQERGVCRSTVCRTLHRAENRLRRCLRY